MDVGPASESSPDSAPTPPGEGDTLVADGLSAGSRQWQRTLFIIIFGHGTPAGRAFDIVLLLAIVASTIAVMLESVRSIRETHGPLLYGAEWAFTVIFTIEYVLRLACVGRKLRYATSFFGVVDLLAILPTYVSLFVPGAQALATVRALRLLRIFRVLKLVRFIGEAAALKEVVWVSRAKIAVFLLVVSVVVTIVGALMHLIEGRQPDSPYASIPQSIYWAIVTMATVGYGDIVPVTPAGKFLAALLIIFGYALIVVPTGIVTAEWQAQTTTGGTPPRHPPCRCGQSRHDADARFCKSCGEPLG